MDLATYLLKKLKFFQKIFQKNGKSPPLKYISIEREQTWFLNSQKITQDY